MKKSTLFMALSAATVMSTAAVAQEDDKKADWSGTGQLGFSMTSGNSDTENLTAGLKLSRESEKWVNNWSLDVLHASSDNVDTAERFTINTRNGYKLDDNDYIHNSTRYDNDNFSGFDYTVTSSLGWGHQFYDTETYKLVTEIGLGYKIEALDIDRSENSGMVAVGKLDFMRQITETTAFEDVLVVESGEDNTFIQNDAGFKFKVSDKFGVKLAHQYRYNTDAPLGKDSTDTLVSANLVYDF
jgi:putative salt-induced outer membrane protein